MLNNYLRKAALLLFIIPFVYFALLLDFRYHSVFGFIFLIFLALLAGFIFQYTKQLLFLFIGNIVSTVTSYLSCLKFSDWHFFYQPFKPTQLILILAVIYLIPQALGIFWAAVFLHRKPDSEHIV